MEAIKDTQYEGLTDMEKAQVEEESARARQVFDPIAGVYDSRKRRVTDLKECSKVTLPKPLTPEEEANLEMRRKTQNKIYEKFRKEFTNHRGEQVPNLTRGQQEGLKSLEERIRKEEIVVMKTEKSSRFVVTSREEYLKMGEEHTSKDKKSWESRSHGERENCPPTHTSMVSDMEE